MGILTGTETEQDDLTEERRSRCPPWRRNKTIYTMYTSLTGHNHPSSTAPLFPWVKEIEIVRQRSWEMDNWSGCGSDAVEEDNQGSRGEAMAGDLKWKLYRSKFILDQSLRPEAAASFLNTRSYSNQAELEKWRAVCMISSLYLDRSGQWWGWAAHSTIWKIVKASVQVKMSFISTCLRFDEDTTSLPSRNVCGSCFMARRFTDNKSANWTNENREGIGACPGPTIKAFSDLCDANEDSRLRRPLVTPGDTKVERVGATDGLSSRR